MGAKTNYTLKTILDKFSLLKDEFSSYDSYYASKVLLMVFYDKTSKSTTDFMEFVIDVMLEHFEPEDLEVLKEFLKDFESMYKTLIRRLENVSIDE
jgi:hypothetical protein